MVLKTRHPLLRVEVGFLKVILELVSSQCLIGEAALGSILNVHNYRINIGHY